MAVAVHEHGFPQKAGFDIVVLLKNAKMFEYHVADVPTTLVRICSQKVARSTIWTFGQHYSIPFAIIGNAARHRNRSRCRRRDPVPLIWKLRGTGSMAVDARGKQRRLDSGGLIRTARFRHTVMNREALV
jgi:hypothetical protein